MKSKKMLLTLSLFLLIISIFSACKRDNSTKINDSIHSKQLELQELLETQTFNDKQRYSILRQIAETLREENDYQGLILFLTDWVDNNPDDMYNSY